MPDKNKIMHMIQKSPEGPNWCTHRTVGHGSKEGSAQPPGMSCIRMSLIKFLLCTCVFMTLAQQKPEGVAGAGVSPPAFQRVSQGRHAQRWDYFCSFLVDGWWKEALSLRTDGEVELDIKVKECVIRSSICHSLPLFKFFFIFSLGIRIII